MSAVRYSLRSQLSILLWFAVCGLPGAATEPETVRFEASHDAMGTVFTIVAYGRDARYLAEVANQAFDEIDRLDAQMSHYQPESELSRINRVAAREAVTVEPRLFSLIVKSIRASETSGGAFDITVGPLMKAWGFFRGEGKIPTPSELAGVRKRVGYRHIHLNAERREIRFDVEGLEIDLGGIAKGYAVDRAAEILRRHGVEAALVSGGASSIVAVGAPPGERAWRIRLRHPYGKRPSGERVWLKNFSLSVSGSYEKSFSLQGKTFCHILDARSGRPVEDMLMTAVLAPEGVDGDALSTALFVLKAEKGGELMKTLTTVSAVLYEARPGRRFRRVAVQSPGWKPPEDVVAEFEPQAEMKTE